MNVRGSISGADAPSVSAVAGYLSPSQCRSANEIWRPACGLGAEVPTLAVNADNRIWALFCGWGSDESCPALVAAMPKAPVSVRLFVPAAAGRPAEASIASSTAMLASPPGPQPVTPGAVKVLSLAVAFVRSRTAVSGCSAGFGSFLILR